MHILQQEILLSDNSTPTIVDKKKYNFKSALQEKMEEIT